MSRLTQSLLTLARVEAVGERERREVVDVDGRDRRGVEAVEAPRGRRAAGSTIEPDLAAEGDPMLLRQVMIGLLTNACKHTPPPGTVTLRAPPEAEKARSSSRSRTPGTGIPPEEIDRVFERFYRGSGSRERGLRPRPGDRRRMVDVMGGEIGATPCEGEGSTFWVRLPRAPSRRPTPVGMSDALGMSSGASWSPTTSPRSATRSATRSTRRASRSRSPPTATRPRSKLGDDIHFDLLILDIMMPGRSGLDICREVRAPQPRADHPPDRQGRRGRQGRRPRGRRRRLRHQAVLGARAARPRPRPAAPPRARPLAGAPRRTGSKPARSRSTSPATWSRCAASRST